MPKLIKLKQPNDHVYRGREVWINPGDVIAVFTNDHTAPGQCNVTLRNGDEYILDGEKDTIAEQINAAQ